MRMSTDEGVELKVSLRFLFLHFKSQQVRRRFKPVIFILSTQECVNASPPIALRALPQNSEEDAELVQLQKFSAPSLLDLILVIALLGQPILRRRDDLRFLRDAHGLVKRIRATHLIQNH